MMIDEVLNNKLISEAKCIVVKIGSSLLIDNITGSLRRGWLEALAEDIERCRKRGQKIIIVSSGAIALGRRYLKLKSGDLRLEEKQAAAAAGMVRLAHAYQECFEPHDLSVAQILLTRDDSENRRRYLNARSTLMTLLGVGAIPLINENDTVATEEIRFGDNLPKTRSGKIMRRLLKARELGLPEGDTSTLEDVIKGWIEDNNLQFVEHNVKESFNEDKISI